jgi:hypothetical protein
MMTITIKWFVFVANEKYVWCLNTMTGCCWSLIHKEMDYVISEIKSGSRILDARSPVQGK